MSLGTDKQILVMRPTDFDDYSRFLSGKKVVLVGPAPHMLGSKRGKLIDSYDVVVRVNKALMIKEGMEDDIGNRTDVLYNCLMREEESGGAINPGMLRGRGVRFLCCPYPDVHPFRFDIAWWRASYGDSFPVHLVDRGYYTYLQTLIRTRPNTGFSAILELLCHQISELYVTGVTFFKGGYFSAYRPMNEEQVMNRMAAYGNHDQIPQMALFKRLMATEKRLRVDEELKVLMESFVN